MNDSQSLFTSFYYSRVMRGIASVTHKRGYNLVLFDSDVITEIDGFASYAQFIKERYVDGMLILAADSVDDWQTAEKANLKDQGMPFVFLWRKPPNIDADCVPVDNIDGTRKAIDHLVGLGHDRIAILTFSEDSLSSKERLDGYRLALAAHGIPFAPELVRVARHCPERDEQVIHEPGGFL